MAFVLLWYPLFTQPFIFREVECLGRILPLQVYTLYGPNMRHCSQEMKCSTAHICSYGLKSLFPILLELLRAICKNPRQLWRLFRDSLWRHWNSLEVLGENLWAFCVGVSLGRRFREDGIDLVYAPWPRGAATAARVGAAIAGLPFGIAARGDNLDPADPDLEDKLRDALFIRANNKADKNRIENFGQGCARGKTVLLYNSLTLPPDRIGGNVERFVTEPLRLLALGRFDVTKGFDVLLAACAILKQRGVKFTLTLAGAGGRVLGLGSLEDALRAQRHDLDLEGEVGMPGLISHDELPGILSRHDIFVAPCVIHSSGRRDGIPNTVIEALAYGMPVVSTNVNALPEIVRAGCTGVLVPPNDPEALADAIMWMAAHPDEAIVMGKNGASLASELFEPAANARRMAEVFIKAYAVWKKRIKGPGEEKCAA